MFLPLRNAEIISAVSSALSQKCSGSSYPYIRNGFFKLSVIQEVSNITQIALRKLRNKNTIFLSYHQTFSSRFFEFLSSHGSSFCPELSNYRIFVFTRNITDCHGFSFFSFLVPNYRIIEFLSSHGISRIVTDFLFSFLVPNYRIFEFLSSHGISQTVTDFLFSFLVPNFRIIEFYLSCPETCPLSRIIEFLSSVTFRDSPCDYKK